MPIFRRAAVFFAVLLALLWNQPASASTVLAYDIPTLTTQSDLIVRGKVVRVVGKWVGKRIITEVTIQVNFALKGGGATEVTLYTLGGVAGGIGMKVSGAPTFVAEEEVLVFLQKRAGLYQVLGMGQGKYHLEKDQDGKKIAIPEVEGLSLVKRAADGSLVRAEPPKALSLSDLETQITRALTR